MPQEKQPEAPRASPPTPKQRFQEPSKGHSGPWSAGYAQLQTPERQDSSWAILSPCSTGIRCVQQLKGKPSPGSHHAKPLPTPSSGLLRKEEAQGSGAGEKEKLSKSRGAVRKMEAESEVKGKSNSQGSRRLWEGLTLILEKTCRSLGASPAGKAPAYA